MIDNTVEFEARTGALPGIGMYVAIPKGVAHWGDTYRVTLTRLDEPKPEVQYRGKSLSQMTREELEVGIWDMERRIAISRVNFWPSGWCVDVLKMLRGELATRLNPEPESVLNPCPFCGSTSPKIGIRDRGEYCVLRYYVTCQGCGGEGPSETTEAAAIAEWNRRASIPEPAKHQEPESRYPMCADQHAQVDCRRTKCRYHQPGKCTNVSPAITLGEDGAGRCWSYKPA
jgi:Lar family restriction alleviation protein